MGSATRQTIGWREWVRLVDLGGAVVKAKVDTGARTSALHAYEITEVDRGGERWVEFVIHPIQRDERTTVKAAARVVDQREVTPSSGHKELRYVIETEIEMNGESFPIELTLTNRDQMGFRMLLGRRALRDRFLVDPKRSFRTAESKERRRRARREAETGR
jgi:hypothetical protein